MVVSESEVPPVHDGGLLIHPDLLARTVANTDRFSPAPLNSAARVQSGALAFGLLVDRNIGVGILPESEETLVGGG